MRMHFGEHSVWRRQIARPLTALRLRLRLRLSSMISVSTMYGGRKPTSPALPGIGWIGAQEK